MKFVKSNWLPLALMGVALALIALGESGGVTVGQGGHTELHQGAQMALKLLNQGQCTPYRC